MMAMTARPIRYFLAKLSMNSPCVWQPRYYFTVGVAGA
jgi:hypothetical protein